MIEKLYEQYETSFSGSQLRPRRWLPVISPDNRYSGGHCGSCKWGEAMKTFKVLDASNDVLISFEDMCVLKRKRMMPPFDAIKKALNISSDCHCELCQKKRGGE